MTKASLLPVLPLLLGLFAPLPLAAAPEEDELRKDLERARQGRQAGKRIISLEAELLDAKLWVEKAILLVELADTKDVRAVRALGSGLLDKHRHVSAFALHGLLRLPGPDLRRGGGEPLFKNLLKAMSRKSVYHRQSARRLLTSLVGQDLGAKASKWKSWLRKHKDELVLDRSIPGFDSSRYDPEAVEKVRQEGQAGATSVRKRIPKVTSEIAELRRKGLDIVLCLDETSSMTKVIEEAKAKLGLLLNVLRQVVENYRVGLVTYNDAVKTNEALSHEVGRLQEVLDRVKAVGGGDMPEGADKALDVALELKFGWRRDAAKTVVVLGDAPPHPEDMDGLLTRLKLVHEQVEITVNTVSTGAQPIAEFERIAKATGGQSLSLKDPSRLVGEVLLLIFGERLRPAMERFVPVLLEVLEAQDGGA